MTRWECLPWQWQFDPDDRRCGYRSSRSDRRACGPTWAASAARRTSTRLRRGGKIREVRPNIEVSRDAVAVIHASNRIVSPGFVDTHSHSYQGLLRNILVNGLLNPDYNRDIQNILTPAYQAADAYAGMLVTALGFIDMGTTAIVDISQVSHTPEHSDACIRALQDSGIRAVFAYHRGAGPAAEYPQDIKRLQRTYFSSKDQLLTLALTANLNANVFALAREV